jgi:hypothetical protein
MVRSVCLFLLLGAEILVFGRLSAAAAEEPGQFNAGHGPHAGYVQSQGEYATELLPEGVGRYRIWLLEPTWMSVDPRGLTANLVIHRGAPLKEQNKVGEKDTPEPMTLSVPCAAERDGFRCDVPEEKEPSERDSLRIEFQFGVKGKPAVRAEYKFPLQHFQSPR